jgi:hypothetical protein
MRVQEWKTYRTRFLVKAKQLHSSLSFTDPLGRQHCGRKGDYLVESSDGVISIAPRQIFEDIYVVVESAHRGSERKQTAISSFDQDNLQDRPIADCQLNSLAIEPLDIEEVQLNPPPMGRQYIARPRTLRQDETARLRRKLPESFRERRSAPSRFGLM